jgi:hypothetical protein
VENSGNSGKTHRIFLNFVENTVVHERNLLEKWGHPQWNDGILEYWISKRKTIIVAQGALRSRNASLRHKAKDFRP